MIRIGYGNYHFVMIVNGRLTRDEFIKRCGAERGYAKDMFGSIYDSIFAEAEDVRQIYEEYYKVEYDSYESFMLMHYCLRREWLDLLLETLQSNKDYKLIDYDTISYGEGGIDDLIFSDNMRERIEDILLMKD